MQPDYIKRVIIGEPPSFCVLLCVIVTKIKISMHISY